MSFAPVQHFGAITVTSDRLGVQLRAGNGLPLFGNFGGAVNITDGRYTYHRFPANLNAGPRMGAALIIA